MLLLLSRAKNIFSSRLKKTSSQISYGNAIFSLLTYNSWTRRCLIT